MKISRYRVPKGDQAATQPGSQGRVLLNRLGITSKSVMDRHEAERLAHVQETYYARLTSKTRITASLIKRMHQDWLGEIYAWAGQYRWVELEKNGFRWPPAERVADKICAISNAACYVSIRRANLVQSIRSQWQWRSCTRNFC